MSSINSGSGMSTGRALSTIPNIERRLAALPDDDPLLFRFHDVLYTPSAPPSV
jgi:hypothetical protein